MEIEKDSLLIVDDDRLNLLMLIEILQQSYIIYTAKSGEEAIKKAGKYHPDLILLDIVLPGINGYEVLEILRGSEETGDIPVIFITGLNEAGDEEKGIALGAVDYIAKPFKPENVKLKVMRQFKIINQ